MSLLDIRDRRICIVFRKNEAMAKLAKITGEKEELEKQLKSAEERISGLEKDLAAARGKISELETALKDTDLEELKGKARQSAAEFEGLKELYNGKIREFDDSRVSREEEFARESAVKRHNLEDEIQNKREDAEETVSNTVKDFAGSYLYYMDQIRMMMDALSQAAADTGSSLFSGGQGDVKERFGASIAGYLRKDVDALEQGTGDRLLIGATEAAEEKETLEETAPAEQEPEEDVIEPDPFDGDGEQALDD